VAALFQLKITSSGRGALASTRCVHFNSKDRTSQQSSEVPREDQTKETKTYEELTGGSGNLPTSRCPC
jgi:hypothetical protein